MKKAALMLFALTVCYTGFAQNGKQDTTIIYNSPMYTKDPIRSRWRPVVKHTGELYQVTFYDGKDIVQELIHFEDKDLTVRKGPYVRYQKGNPKEKGNYDKGHKDGEWITYTNNNVMAKTEHFSYGKLEGKSVEYWDGKQVQEEGAYHHDKKNGEWKLFYRDGKTAGEEFYEDGKKTTGKYFNADGNLVKYEDLFSAPNYKGGINQFYRYLASEIKYPAQSARQGVQGTVRLSFLVKKNGQIEDIQVVESPNHELAAEAIRVLQMSPDWIPGKRFGEIVNVKYALPVKFSMRL